jgi:zinc protease
VTTELGRGLSPSRLLLPNGAVLLAQHTPVAPAVTITASFEAGSLYDPYDLPGTAELVSNVLDRGTDRRTADAIADELDGRGVALEAIISRHTLTLSATCLAEDFDPILDLLVDVIRRPLFEPAEVARRRLELITEIRQEDDNPYIRAAAAVTALLYGPQHPYARSLRGRVDAVERIEPADLRSFHARRLRPSVLSLAMVGAVSPELAVDCAAAALDDWSAPAAEHVPVPVPLRATGRRCELVEMPGKPQADIAYGFTTIRRLDPRHDAYRLMSHVLGEFGVGGRLAANLRERRGMAYYAFSSFDPTVGEGPLLLRAGVDPANVDQAIDAIDSEVRRLGASGPTPGELDESRQYLIGSLPRLLETNRTIAGFLLEVERFGLGLDYDRRLPDLLRQVSLDDVRAAAAETLQPERACVAVAGPAIALRAA